MLLGLAILLACVGCDQVTKTVATRTLAGREVKSFWVDTVRLDYALNPGGFLSLGSQMPDDLRKWTFIAINSGLLLGLGVFLGLKRNLPFALFVALVLILAGGIGNLIDRLCHDGLVTDFINIGIGPVRTGIFNVADMAIMAGGIALVWLSLKRDTGKHGDVNC